MTDYIHDSALVADSVSFLRAANASITVYDADDATNAVPLILKDLNGLPLANPLTSSQDAFTPAFVTSSAQVKLVGGGLTVVLNSYQGLREDALAAQTEAQEAKAAAIGAQAAAETAGADAAEAAAAALADAVEDAETAKAAAEAAAALVGAPVDSAISTVISASGSETRTVLNATYGPLANTMRAAFAPQGFASPRQVGDGKSGALDYRHEGTSGYLTHFVMGANSLALAGCYAAGTDLGLGDGFFVSHKNGGAGFRGVGHGGSSILQYMVGYSHSTLYNGEIFKGNQGMKLFAKIGEGYGDGMATSGSTTFTSATANFTAADVGATIQQTTSKGSLNVSGTIPSGTTIASVTNATTVVLSAAATASGTGITFLVGGRVPAATQQYLTMYDTNGTSKRYEFALGKYTGAVPHEIQSNDIAVQSLLLKAAPGQTAEILTVLKDGNAAGALSVLASGLVALRFGSSLGNAGNTASNAVNIANSGTAAHSLYITRGASQTGDQISLRDSGGALQTRIDKDGVIMTKVTTAPVDAQLTNGELSFYFDSTNGAAKLKIKAKQADGTVRTGEVPLS